MMNREMQRDIALLYVAAAIAPDGHLSDGEVARIEDALAALWSPRAGSMREEIVAALGEFPREASVRTTLIDRVVRDLRESLSPEQREVALRDLVGIARADGVVLERERSFINTLAAAWGVEAPSASQLVEPEPAPPAPWDAYHDLALIYLVLAHGTDNELSQSEINVMLRKLQEWQPDLEEDRIRQILRTAMDRYAAGPDEQSIYESVRAVRRAMPAEQRKAALQDLVQIANADGVFLDNEEDLINNLVAEWDVDPYVTYGRHGDKDRDVGGQEV